MPVERQLYVGPEVSVSDPLSHEINIVSWRIFASL